MPSRVGVGGGTGAEEGGGNLRKVADDSGASGANVDEHTRNLHAIVDGGQMQRGAAVPASRVTLRAPLENIAGKLRSKVTRITIDTSRARSRLLLRRRAAGRRQRAPFQPPSAAQSTRPCGGGGGGLTLTRAVQCAQTCQCKWRVLLQYCTRPTWRQPPAFRVHVRSSGQQQARHFQMALFSRAVQRRPAAPGRSTA